MQEIEEEGQDEIEEEAQDDRQPTSGDGGDKEEKEKRDSADRLKRNVSELTRQKEDRLQTLETSIFQLANYYFVFQGVIFSAVFDSSHVKCVHRTVAVILSLTAAALNLTALIFIARRHRDWSSDLDEASELRGELFGTKTPKSSTSELRGELGGTKTPKSSTSELREELGSTETPKSSPLELREKLGSTETPKSPRRKNCWPLSSIVAIILLGVFAGVNAYGVLSTPCH